MKRFIVLYHTPGSVMKRMEDVSPEEMKKGMEPWMAWAKKCGDSLVDMGTPLEGGRNISKIGVRPSKKEVTGYSVLQAENMGEAIKLLENHPHLEWDNSSEIEIHESVPLTEE